MTPIAEFKDGAATFSVGPTIRILKMDEMTYNAVCQLLNAALNEGYERRDMEVRAAFA